MATRDVFSEDELAQLRGFPEPARAELIRYFTLSPADEEFVRKFRSRENVMGAGVQLCTLPWLGYVPDDVAPAAVAARLSEKLGIPVGELRGYGARGQTRTDHLREVAAHLGWRQVDGPHWKDLEEFLFARAMEHDSAKLLFRQACEYLSSSRLVRPGVVNILERVATARDRARDETWERLGLVLTGRRCGELDGMLTVDPVLGCTRLSWLGAGPVAATPGSVKGELEKLGYLRGMDADTLDPSVLPAERRRFLAGLGRRLTAQNLARRDDDRRYPILLTLVAQSAVDVLDEVLLLFDQALSGRESAARERLTEALAKRARGGENRQALLDDILKIVLDPDTGDDQIGLRLRRDIGHERMRAAWEARRERLPRDHGHLAMMDASMAYLRQFVPDVLAAVRFAGGPGMDDLLLAVAILAGLYAGEVAQGPGRRPGQLRARPVGRVPRERGEIRGRHRLPALLGAVRADGPARRAALGRRARPRVAPVRRPGLVPAHPAAVGAAAAGVLPPGRQARGRRRRSRPGRRRAARGAGGPGNPARPRRREGRGPPQRRRGADHPAADRRGRPGRGRRAARRARRPAAPRPGRLSAGGDRRPHRVPRPPGARRRQGHPPGGPEAQPAVRDHRRGHQHGPGRDGRVLRHPLRRAGLDGRVVLPRRDARGGQRRDRQLPPPAADDPGLRHRHPGVVGRPEVPGQGKVADRPAHVPLLRPRPGHLHLHPRLGPALDVRHQGDRGDLPESPYVLDGIRGNQTDLLVTEHATDSHGATLANFALSGLLGLQLSPRIRDLGKVTLYRTGPRAGFAARYPSAGQLLTRRLNDDLISGMWDDLLRVGASVKGGHATAALVVGKLCSSRRQQNALAAAIKEYGALRRTVYAARYLADETYRRRISRQLNKGENVHALKRSLAYAGEGALRRRHHEEQAEQMWCLTLATNAVITWTTEYNGLAVTALRRAGRDVDDAMLAHIWPTHHENVHFCGTHSVDVDGELSKLGSDGYRPLRAPGPAAAV